MAAPAGAHGPPDRGDHVDRHLVLLRVAGFRLQAVVPAAPGVDGELYMVHGSFFYRVEKRHFGAGEAPTGLHWFKWAATFTWITGFLLLWLVYYINQGAYLIDPSVKASRPTWPPSPASACWSAAGWAMTCCPARRWRKQDGFRRAQHCNHQIQLAGMWR